MSIGRHKPVLLGADKPVVVSMGTASYRTTRATLASGEHSYLSAISAHDWLEMQREEPHVEAPSNNDKVSDYIMLWVRDRKLPAAIPQRALQMLRKEAKRLHFHDLMDEIVRLYGKREAVRQNPSDLQVRLELISALAGDVSREKLGKKLNKVAALDAPRFQTLKRFLGTTSESFADYHLDFLAEAERHLHDAPEGAALRQYLEPEQK